MDFLLERCFHIPGTMTTAWYQKPSANVRPCARLLKDFEEKTASFNAADLSNIMEISGAHLPQCHWGILEDYRDNIHLPNSTSIHEADVLRFCIA